MVRAFSLLVIDGVRIVDQMVGPGNRWWLPRLPGWGWAATFVGMDPHRLTLLLLGLAACSQTELPGYDAGATPTAIRVVPAQVQMTLAHDKVAEQAFCAYAFYGGQPADAAIDDAGLPAGGFDVTEKVSWSALDPGLGRFVGSTFRTEVEREGKTQPAGHGGRTHVLAILDGTEGAAELAVTYEKAFFGPKAPADSASKFNGTVAAARAPTLVYPAAETLLPLNLGQLELQWIKGNGNDLFEVRIQGDLLDVWLYSVEDGFELDGAAWQAVAQTCAEDKVTVTVQATSLAAPAQRGVSKPVTLEIARSGVKGGLYYWVVTQDTGGIYRYDFDSPAEPAQAFYTDEQAKDCVGCHAVSRGGKRVAFTKSGGNGNTVILDTETRTPILDSKYRGNLQTFSPAGDQIIVAYMGALSRREVQTGDELEILPTGPGKATHPDWSTDGNKLVYVAVKDADYTDDVHFKNGSIALLTRQGSGWTAPTTLVSGAAGVNNYYPSFSPQDDWIVFNRSGGDSYSDEDANLYIVKPDGGTPLPLTRLNGSKLSNSWPRWSPFIQKYKETTIYWLTFSSVRDYGLRLKNSSVPVYDDRAPQIWMAAFDLTLAAAGKDPSTPPFWLPFQDMSRHNHIAQWTEKVIAIK